MNGLVDGYDNPVTDKFFEFGINVSDDEEVKRNPVYEEAEGKL